MVLVVFFYALFAFSFLFFSFTRNVRISITGNF